MDRIPDPLRDLRDNDEKRLTYGSYHVGLLYWGAFRDQLKSLAFHGREVTWIESSGFLSRTFTVKAPPLVHQAIEEMVDKLSKKEEEP